MTLLEAIQNCGENWFRPNRITGSGCAYSTGEKHTLFQCAEYMPEYVSEFDEHMSSLLEDLTGDWEIVTPEQVMGERV